MCKNDDKNNSTKTNQNNQKPVQENFEKRIDGNETKISTTGQETGEKRPKY